MGNNYAARIDSSNNIADGNVINASDFDNEFDAIVNAFNTSGHTHSGAAGEGGPVSKIGPSQQVEVDANAIFPASDGATDLGKTDKEWKDLFVDGVINTDDMSADTISVLSSATIGSTIDIGSNASVGGTLNVTGDSDLEDVSASGTLDVAGNISGGGTLTVTGAVSTASTLLVSAGITGRSTLEIGGNASIGGTFRVTDETNLEDVSASGTLDISGNMSGGGTFTLAGKATFDGAVTVQSTLTVAGAVSAHSSLNVTGNISSNGTLTTTGAISDGDGNLRDVPQARSLANSANLAATDIGNFVLNTSANNTLGVANGVFGTGQIVSIVNKAGSCTIVSQVGSSGFILAGAASATSTAILADHGVCSLLFIGQNSAFITGNVS